MSIKKEITNGVFWGMVSKYSGIVIQLIITAVLARLLSPEDFGVIAITTILINFFTLFTDMGIGPAIIQSRELTTADLDSIFSFCIYCGFLQSLIFWGMSRLIASFFQSELLVPICRILSINLLFAACNIVPNALILKNKRFKFIAERTLGLQVTGGGIAIIAAFNGLEVYSLLIVPVLTAVGTFILNYRQYPLKIRFYIDKKPLYKIFSYSIFQFLFNLINYFSRNLDKLIIGKNFNLGELGYYEKSYRLMTLPLQNITHVFTPVMHPVLASLQDNYSELTNKYNKIIKLLATISFPLGVFLYFTGEDIIMIVYGHKWEAAVPVFQILSLSVPLQMILSTTGAIYQSSGKTKWLFYNGVCNSFCTITGFIIAALYFHDIEAMAWAWTVTLLTNFIVSYFILYRIVLKQSVTPIIKSCAIPLLEAICLIGILWICDIGCIYLPHIIALFFMTIIALVVSLAIIHFSHQYNLVWVWKRILINLRQNKHG